MKEEIISILKVALLVFVLLCVAIFLYSGTIPRQINKEYNIVSVNQIYVKGDMKYIVNYIDEHENIITLVSGDYIHIKIVNSSKNLMVHDAYTPNGIKYYTVYLNSYDGIDALDSEWTEVHTNGKVSSTRTVHTTSNRVY